MHGAQYSWVVLFTVPLLGCSGYKNVLVIPSWNDDAIRFSRLTQSRNSSFVPYGGSGIHMFPLVHWYNECSANLTVATVEVQTHSLTSCINSMQVSHTFQKTI